ncbi:prepilin-type N-terminal cleavage/methylation domain-containing protein [Gracilibacillus caseinilyticus]|uniref:Prepilin-type N-terminal cleavage/methylation domain-containing protein n=1 Tax=Gracilibacillus caseinilyticus TaxID=2932256 RepID=A0ABY4ETR3_9BACI|nr:competence type IV pilus minor pilin ComGD [Gracilibacillus caseinilyticus]UOQ47461.1 prepilin-type N-terminal cleavage/methylation domain-containing protein [Gracilibacillus caseinilyticus]
MMKKNDLAFTLPELLIALTITSLLLLISGSAWLRLHDTVQYKQFIKQFNRDLLYLQQLALSREETYYLQIDTSLHRYTIRKRGLGTKVLERVYSKDWEIDTNTLIQPIEFSHNGNLKRPGTMKIRTQYRLYLFKCPFGKGRCYVQKE